MPVREEELVSAWSEMADWTSAEIRGSNWATLLQHQEKPNVFLTFGPWESAGYLAAWRESPAFRSASEGSGRPSRISGPGCSTAAPR
jgi:heme-degrading monooxygenase HmoA